MVERSWSETERGSENEKRREAVGKKKEGMKLLRREGKGRVQGEKEAKERREGGKLVRKQNRNEEKGTVAWEIEKKKKERNSSRS